MKPLPSELRLWEKKIQELLKRNKNPKALILGVTPEIRDLLTKYKIDTVCLDKNPLMVQAMALLTKRKNSKEKIVLGSWLTMPFKAESFDLVLADCPHDNLPYKLFPRFFANVTRVIKPSGYFMIGTHHFVGKTKPLSFDAFIRIFKKSPRAFEDQSVKFYYYLQLSGNKRYYNKKTKVWDWIKLAADLQRLREKGVLTARELEQISFPVNEVGLTLAMRFTSLSQGEFEDFMKKNGLVLAAFWQDDELPAGMFRQTFIFKKNKQ